MDMIRVMLTALGYERVKGLLVEVVETPTGVVYRVQVFRKGIDQAPRIIGFTADAVRLPSGFVPVVEPPAVVEPAAVTLTYRRREGNTVRFIDSSGMLVKLTWDGKTQMRRRSYTVTADEFGVITNVKAA